MNQPNQAVKNAIIEAALSDVAFDGWTLAVLEGAAVRAGYGKEMVRAVFPEGVQDAVIYFSAWANAKMLERLEAAGTDGLRVREKIALAVRTRFEILEPYREAEAKALAYWIGPFRKWIGGRLVWRTADAIWNWAGDTATDYNRYTKRALLCGVLTSLTLFWLNDKSKGKAESWAFLDRRIDNVMSLGKIVRGRKKA